MSLMWLWRPIDHLVFEVEPRRVGQFVSFGDTADLAGDVARLAYDAREAVSALLARFDGLQSVIDYLESSTRVARASDLGHLATAYGLSGDLDLARSTFDAALAAREEAASAGWRAPRYLVDARGAADSESGFRTWVSGALTATREALKLPYRANALDQL